MFLSRDHTETLQELNSNKGNEINFCIVHKIANIQYAFPIKLFKSFCWSPIVWQNKLLSVLSRIYQN